MRQGSSCGDDDPRSHKDSLLSFEIMQNLYMHVEFGVLGGCGHDLVRGWFVVVGSLCPKIAMVEELDGLCGRESRM